MKKYISWIFLGLLCLGGMGVTVYFALQPKPIPKIKFSHFEKPEQMAAALVQRLRLEIQASPVLFLGVDPEVREHYQVWKSFLQLAEQEGFPFKFLVIDPFLPFKDEFVAAEGSPSPAAVTEIDLNTEISRFVEGAKAAQLQGQRIAVIVPTLYATKLLPLSPAAKLAETSQLQNLSFSMSLFPRNRKDEKKMNFPCVSETQDVQGTQKIGCMILNKSRTVYRKKDEPLKGSGLADQVGRAEYLVLYNPKSEI